MGKCLDLLSIKKKRCKKMNNYFKMLSAAVVIGALRVNIDFKGCNCIFIPH